MQTWRMLLLGALIFAGIAATTLWLLGLWPKTTLASVLVPVMFSPVLSVGCPKVVNPEDMPPGSLVKSR